MTDNSDCNINVDETGDHSLTSNRAYDVILIKMGAIKEFP
jgi:hypothetical protein